VALRYGRLTKIARAELGAVIGRVQLGFVPRQAPAQDRKRHPFAPIAVKVSGA
jgi:hypothetical protein